MNLNIELNEIKKNIINIIELENKILKTNDRFIKLLLIDELNNIKKKLIIKIECINKYYK
jgi:hypothetical protein